jgi:hypothetical protein
MRKDVYAWEGYSERQEGKRLWARIMVMTMSDSMHDDTLSTCCTNIAIHRHWSRALCPLALSLSSLLLTLTPLYTLFIIYTTTSPWFPIPCLHLRCLSFTLAYLVLLLNLLVPRSLLSCLLTQCLGVHLLCLLLPCLCTTHMIRTTLVSLLQQALLSTLPTISSFRSL